MNNEKEVYIMEQKRKLTPNQHVTNGTRVGLTVLIAAMLALLAPLGIAAPRPISPITESISFTQFEMNLVGDFVDSNVNPGGRIDAVARSNQDVIMAGSESGGLFRSVGDDSSWRHLDSFPLTIIHSIKSLGSGSKFLVTASDDWNTNDLGGIWLSTDNGESWSRPPSSTPQALVGCSAPMVAREIDVDSTNGQVFVATSCGILTSSDAGATWQLTGLSINVFAVAVLGNNRIIAGGASGFFWSQDNGATWLQSANPGGRISNPNRELHSLSKNPRSSLDAYANLNGGDVWATTRDGGQTWTTIQNNAAGVGLGCRPNASCCGGNIFSHADVTVNGVVVYFSTPCQVFRLKATLLSGVFAYPQDRPEDWDIFWFSNDPRSFTTANGVSYLGSDHGLYRFAGDLPGFDPDVHNYPVVQSGAMSGLNALQVYDVKGKNNASTVAANSLDVYFGTQDNMVWGSDDDGWTWSTHIFAEGGVFELDRNAGASSEVYFKEYSSGTGQIGGRLFRNRLRDWNRPSEGQAFEPNIILGTTYVQFRQSTPTTVALAITRDAGTNWSDLVTINGKVTGRARLAGPTNNPVVYMPVSVGATTKLLRISNVLGTRQVVTYPNMGNFGTLGVFPLYFAYDFVLIADPVDPNHLIAPDGIDGKVKQSFDGGNTWQEIVAVNNLITLGGQLKANLGTNTQLSSGAICPENSNKIVIASQHAGIIFSSDGGGNWQQIARSEQIPLISSVFWRKNCAEFVISSYGRGIWKFTIEQTYSTNSGCGPLRSVRLRYLNECWYIASQGRLGPFPKPGLDWGLVVLNGRITGMNVKEGKVTDLTVLPGSKVIGLGNSLYTKRIKWSESAKSTFQGIKGIKNLEGQKLGVMGIGFKDSRLAGLLVSDTKITDAPVAKPKPPVEQSTVSPYEKLPRLGMDCKSGSGGFCSVESDETVIIYGVNFGEFVSGVYFDLDGHSLKLVSPNADGSLKLDWRFDGLPQGQHHITAYKKETDGLKVLASVTFFVLHQDHAEEQPR